MRPIHLGERANPREKSCKPLRRLGLPADIEHQNLRIHLKGHEDEHISSRPGWDATPLTSPRTYCLRRSNQLRNTSSQVCGQYVLGEVIGVASQPGRGNICESSRKVDLWKCKPNLNSRSASPNGGIPNISLPHLTFHDHFPGLAQIFRETGTIIL